MAISRFNLQFLNHNAVRRYPLVDEATAVDKTGSFELPDDFLVALDLPIHAAMGMLPGQFFLRYVYAYPTGYALTVSYETESEIVDVATAMVPRHSHTRNKVYTLGGLDPYDDTVGKVAIGRLESIDEQPPGAWEFAFAATRLEAHVIRPQLRGVQSLAAVNGGVRSVRLTGDVELVAGDNIELVTILDGGDPVIRINAISGAGLMRTCVCDDETAPCIKTIDGQGPDGDGNIQVVGDDCIQVQHITHGLKLVDLCCKPCCDCQELEAITRDLVRFNQERNTLESFVQQLLATNSQLSLTVLGARLSDQGCVQCPE